jgi:hypothetical protein
MRLLQGFALAGLMGIAVMVAPVRHASAAVLNTPALTETGVSPWRVEMQVTAGASGTPQGFTIQWMKKADFDAAGGWPLSGYFPPGFNYCLFDGVPTWIVTPGVSDFLLGSNVGARVMLGELFDETGIYSTYLDDMVPATQYAVRVYAEGGPSGDESPPSSTMFVTTNTHEDCRFTLGYWKNHPSAWPVLTLKLGNNTYNQAQLISILSQPSLGNGLTILCHQLIAAKLNVLLAAPPASITADIAAADAMIGNLVPPPVGSDTLPSSSTSALATDLDNFNNGQTPGDNCTTPTIPTTWGKLKSLYR